ncbi:DUF4956 domain-containing protein [Actinoplanes bogorensis]|uniref:DUF4956 domain-containing protein n=1 Tax=Paractinoplanes bogorensis TaxID=1610840 RepID=A0ABS5YWP3_9ACTN|nr:DUF4956 domain-containing protein [Actinoplanes bogorensis]MBU2667852.1 DUF4956 domain-containing protein [Actinoplanes bogorensis]
MPDLLLRATVDLVSLLVLTAGLYARRHSGRELLMVYVCFNVGLFVALTMITGGMFPAGVGFGLFGVLSIIRLRSQTFSTAELGYFFLALVLALVDGLSGRNLVLSIIMSAVLLIAVYIADHPGLHPRVHTARLTLARAYPDSRELHTAAEQRLGVTVLDLEVLEIDDVRDTTEVAVRYKRLDGAPRADFALAGADR